MPTNTRRFGPVARVGYCPRPVAGPSLRLFLFHHAGGSHLLYREWISHFPLDWEIHLLDMPGRGRLADLPACDSVDKVVSVFRDEIVLHLDGPFAFFGHSMGGLTAYELTNRLAAERLPEPVWLGLSARGAPGPPEREADRHDLPDAELRRHLAAMGGTPLEILEDEEMWRTFAPLIRSDLKLVEAWRPRPGTPRLRVPLSVFGGTDDVVVSQDRLAAWSEHAERFLGLHLFDGDHFYFRGRTTEMVDLITARARAAVAGLAAAPSSGR